MPIDKPPGIPTTEEFESAQKFIQSVIDQIDPRDPRMPTLSALQVSLSEHRLEPRVAIKIAQDILEDIQGETRKVIV